MADELSPSTTQWLVAGAAGLAGAFVRGLFGRAVKQEDAERAELKAAIRELQQAVRSISDDNIRNDGKLDNHLEKITTLENSLRAFHKRVDLEQG